MLLLQLPSIWRIRTAMVSHSCNKERPVQSLDLSKNGLGVEGGRHAGELLRSHLAEGGAAYLMTS